MPIHLAECDVCQARFRPTIKKIKVGYLRGYSVILNYYECPSCSHIHVTKWDHSMINQWADKVFMLEWNMWMDRKDNEKCEKHKKELEIAKFEETKAVNEVKNAISKNYKFIWEL
jgi:hypothetical protein